MPIPNPTILAVAKMIDHSLLHPTLTDEQLRTGLAVARDCECATACVKPYAVPMATAALAGSGVAVCAVAGFPHGNSHTALKVAEAERAIAEGATEIDVVVNIGKVLGAAWAEVSAELKTVNTACTARGAILKVIFENDYLPDEAIIRLCELCTEHGIAFVKTSTGYGFVKQPGGDYNYRGATDHHLQLMRRHSGPLVQIKAAGGVRTLDDLLRVRALGVTRIGATATEAILAAAVARGFPDPRPRGLPPGGNAAGVAPGY
jgi:deoxyribose-phosphate aldolase